MSDTYLLFNNVSFGYDQSIENLFENVTAHFDSGWSGVVGANGSGKSTLLRLADGTLLPNGGTIQSSGEVVYCPQRTDDPPQHAEWFMTAFDRISMKLIGLLEIEDDWLTRWNTLSHGERKRLQIAVALWREPDVLLLDEPTNHLDTNSTELLLSSLKDFRGTGLLVSHNRFLLDELCHQCVFLDSHSVVVVVEITLKARKLKCWNMKHQ